MTKRSLLTRSTIVAVMLFVYGMPAVAATGTALGPRGGYDFDSDNLVIGGEAEFGRAFQVFKFAPSVDFELGDNSATAINGDLRLYLFHLPETGLHFYGSAGPTVLFASGGGNSQTEIGLSLVAGVKVPMKQQNRYNIEARFGFGDIPDFKLMVAVLFGI